MEGSHDPGSESLAESSGPGTAPVALDPLSDVLRGVKLSGALFFLIDASSPWCVEVPRADAFAPIIMPKARHIISYHIAVEGAGLASVTGREPVSFSAGDVIVFPHGDPYTMQSARGVPSELDPAQTMDFFRAMAAGELPFVITEGGGSVPPAQFVCGFLGCDLRPFNPLLSALPSLLHVRRPNGRAGDDGGDLLGRLVELALAEAQMHRAGGSSIRLGLSELMFVEVVRRHLGSLPAGETGWIAGLRDPIVGRALALLHDRPAAAWTVERLAREVASSRSVLADRFTQLVGRSPMQYLTRWRVQVAARLLADERTTVAAVAAQVGYASEAAFSRTFKKIAGASPAAWRRQPRDRGESP